MKDRYVLHMDKLRYDFAHTSRTLEAMLAVQPIRRKWKRRLLYATAAALIALSITMAIPAGRAWARSLLNPPLTLLGTGYREGEPIYSIDGLNHLAQDINVQGEKGDVWCMVDQVVLDDAKLIVTYKVKLAGEQVKWLPLPEVYVPRLHNMKLAGGGGLELIDIKSGSAFKDGYGYIVVEYRPPYGVTFPEFTATEQMVAWVYTTPWVVNLMPRGDMVEINSHEPEDLGIMKLEFLLDGTKRSRSITFEPDKRVTFDDGTILTITQVKITELSVEVEYSLTMPPEIRLQYTNRLMNYELEMFDESGNIRCVEKSGSPMYLPEQVWRLRFSLPDPNADTLRFIPVRDRYLANGQGQDLSVIGELTLDVMEIDIPK